MKKRIATAVLAATLLRANAGLAAAPLCGDVNNSTSITTTDALLVLKKGVGQSIALNCAAYDTQISTCTSALSASNSDLTSCNTSLTATNVDLVTCKAALAGVCVPDAAASPRFVDNKNGTATDRRTCLQWEQKNGAGGVGDYPNPHDVDNTYQWSSTGTAPDGDAFTDFLAKLNAPAGAGSPSSTGPTTTGCFAEHCDWRLPTIEELRGIPWPAVAPFQPDQASLYWTASAHTGDPTKVWYFDTGGAGADYDGKLGSVWVRAVRSARGE